MGDFPDLPRDTPRPHTLSNNSLLWTEETKLAWQAHNQYGLNLLGACVPETCAPEDIENMGSHLLNMLGLKLKVRYCQQENAPLAPNVTQLTIMLVASCVALTVVLATLVHWLAPVEKFTRASWRNMCLQQSATLLLGIKERKSSPLAFLDGVRVLLSFGVVYAHVSKKSHCDPMIIIIYCRCTCWMATSTHEDFVAQK